MESGSLPSGSWTVGAGINFDEPQDFSVPIGSFVSGMDGGGNVTVRSNDEAMEIDSAEIGSAMEC